MAEPSASAVPMDKALTNGLSTATSERTLHLHGQQMASGAPRMINFRGDVAEKHNYDKIKPLSDAWRSGDVVYIQAESHKTGQVGHYQILGNQWNLLEALAKLD